MPRCLPAAFAAVTAIANSSAVPAQTLIENAPTPQPVVTISASASDSVVNDRMHAWLRAEADNADPVQAASDVNARMARALARAKAVPGVDASTAGYSSYQVTEQNPKCCRCNRKH